MIQFSRTDPAHLRVAAILNRLERTFKAQYIADAVLHYETREAVRRPVIDEKHIEAVVNRILRERDGGAILPPAAAPVVSVSAGKEEQHRLFDETVVFDEAVEALGEEGLGAIVGALELFRKNKK